MPNHVTTKMTVTPEVAQAITRTHTESERIQHELSEIEHKVRIEQAIQNGRSIPPYEYEPLDMRKRFVDFALVIPEPENIFRGGCNGQHPHPNPDGGFYDACWYDWNISNWGTKWNAYDSRVEAIEGDRCLVVFDTAWSHPFPVIEALSRRFPDETIEVVYADEDLGINCGGYTMQNGLVTTSTEFEYGEESRDFAAQVKYGMSYAELEAQWS